MSRAVEIPFSVDRADDTVELRVLGTVTPDEVRVDAVLTYDGLSWAGELTEGELDKVEDRLADRAAEQARGDAPEPYDLDADWNR